MIAATVDDDDSGSLQCSQPSAYNRGRQRSLRLDVLLLDGTQRQVLLDYRANGQDCLDKVCHSLGVFQEVNYFGLTYYGAKREELWVNMRNRLYKQLPPAVAFGGVCRLHLRVKFYVPPHMMLHEETRHQVYLDVRSRLLDRRHWLLDCDLQRSTSSERHEPGGSDSLDNDLSEPALPSRLAALIVQADFGSSSSIRHHRQILRRLLDKDRSDSDFSVGDRVADGLSDIVCCDNRDDDSQDFSELCNSAMAFQSRLSDLSSAAAEYRLLQAACSGLSMYGSHYHDAKDHLDARLTVAVGPDAVWLCRQDGRVSLERYPYPRVQQVTISDRFLYLSLSQENGNIREVGFRLSTPKAANSLYRCVTETHSFFRCDTVRYNVATKTCRDVKGAFVSLFVERDLWSARNFVFDVQRTAKEVHDNARRQMHKCLTAAASPAGKDKLKQQKQQEQIKQMQQFPSAELSSEDSDGENRASLLDRIRRLEQSRLCQLCTDASVSVVFLPCGHMLACSSCANRLETCPVCRADIADRLVCFVPWQQ